MIDIKADFSGGLNLDDAIYNVPKNAYIDAENITTDAIEGANDKSITNIVGNQLVNYNLPAGINVCIGACPNNVRNTLIYFIYNSNDRHLILEYNNDTRVIVPIFQNLVDSGNVDILEFKQDKKITSINVYNRNPSFGEGDLLFFIDSVGRPTTMDIERFKNQEYSPVTRDIINVIKQPPLFPPSSVLYTNDLSKSTNNLRNRLFRFKYRYVYDNNERSVCSPISIIPLPNDSLNLNNNVFKNNVILVQLETGGKDIKSIEFLMSSVIAGINDWSDFSLVENISKENIRPSYLAYQNITGFPSIKFKVQIDFAGIYVPGTVIDIKFTATIVGLVTLATYTVQSGDNLADIINALIFQLNISPYLSSPNPLYVAPNKLTFEYDPANGSFSTSQGIVIQVPSNANYDNLPFIYRFYNDGAYPTIDINESIQLFDYVPDKANAQEMANGNVLVYGGITEGYNNNLVPNVVNKVKTRAVKVQVTTFSATYFPTYPQSPPFVWGSVRFSGVPVAGSVFKFYIQGQATPLVTYTVQPTDFNVTNVVNGVFNAFVAAASPFTWFRLYTFNSSTGSTTVNQDTVSCYLLVNNNLYFFDRIELDIPPQPIATNPIPTFLFSTKRKIGMAYFDSNGKTNGIVYNGELNFPEWKENLAQDVLTPYIYTEVYHQPPIWAKSFSFYLTKELTQFLYWETIDVRWDDVNLANAKNIFFDISNLYKQAELFPTTQPVVNWTFQSGDRLRLVKDYVSGQVFDTNTHDIEILGIIKDPIITGTTPTTGYFVKIPANAIFTNVTTYSNKNFLIQFYRNVQSLPSGKSEVYYEFAQTFPVLNPGTATRAHAGSIQSQGSILPGSISAFSLFLNNPFNPTVDVVRSTFSGTPVPGTVIAIKIKILSSNVIQQLASYTIQPTDNLQTVVQNFYNILLTQSPSILLAVSTNANDEITFSYDNTLYSFLQSYLTVTYPVFNNTPAIYEFYDGDVYFRERRLTLVGTNGNVTTAGQSTISIMDRNFLDTYISAVNNIDGRPNLIDENAREAYYSTFVRFGQAYQPDTNINGLNRFFFNNFDQYDYSYGDIMRFKVRDRFIRVFQKLKVGQVPLYQQIVKDPAGTENLIVSDKLLNPIQYYMGDLGIGDHSESLASYNFADYFTSNIKGIIGRVSNDGVSFLSIDHKVDSWAASKLPLRTGQYKVYGGLDQILGNYIITLEPAPGDNRSYTLVFDINGKMFSTFFTYYPEMMSIVNTVFISFKNGQLWTHDSGVYNNFYGVQNNSTITFAFNQNPLDKKTFTSISQISSQIWDVPVMNTDLNSYSTIKMESNLVDSDFDQLEGTYEAPILRDINSPGGVIDGDTMKGKYMTMKFRAKAPTNIVSLSLVSLKSINSPLNNR